MKVSQALVDALITLGLTTVFGLPGDTGVTIYDALLRREGSIRHVLCRDERHAATAADAYARVSGRLAVVEASSGGGATFLIGGLGEAYAASVPVLVITTDIARRSRDTDAITEIDQKKLFSAVTKWQRTLERADDLCPLLEEAVSAALSGRPAPVHLCIPEDVLEEDWHGQMPHSAHAHLPFERRGGDEAACDEAARLLTKADKPVIVCGGGVHASAAHDEVRTLARLLGAPVATTIHGKGAIAEEDPFWLGIVGANGAFTETNDTVASADVCVLVGTRANATDTNSFTAPSRSAAIIRIEIDETRAHHNYDAKATLIGDARTILQGLTSRLEAAGLRAQRAPWQKALPAAATTMAAQAVVALADVCPGALVVGEAGTPTPNLVSYWRSEEAGRSVILPRGHGSMGFAIPAAVGMAIAAPERRVLCLTTDGSLAMACGELETIARLNLPITIVHLQNGSFGWIKMLQHLYMEKRYFSVDFGAVDAVKVAAGFGLKAAKADSVPSLVAVIRGHHEGPLLIDMAVPAEYDEVPPVAPWEAFLSGALRSRPVY